MAQVSWRTDDGLLARVRVQALQHGLSVNEYLTRLARAATDPTYVEAPAEQIRERLRLAGLLVEIEDAAAPGPTEDEVATARRRSSGGSSLSDLVEKNR